MFNGFNERHRVVENVENSFEYFADCLKLKIGQSVSENVENGHFWRFFDLKMVLCCRSYEFNGTSVFSGSDYGLLVLQI